MTQSYRIPISVHTLATKLAQSISRRIPKEYKPRDEEGERKVLNIRPLNKGLQEGNWLILCSTHEIVKQVCESLEHMDGYINVTVTLLLILNTLKLFVRGPNFKMKKKFQV